MEKNSELRERIDEWRNCYQRAEEMFRELEEETDKKSFETLLLEIQKELDFAQSVFCEIMEEHSGVLF